MLAALRSLMSSCIECSCRTRQTFCMSALGMSVGPGKLATESYLDCSFATTVAG